MASPALNRLIDDLTGRRRITAGEVLALRREVFGAVEVTPGEAEALIRLDENLDDAAPEWSALFVEALTDFLVHQQAPAGHVSEANAEWLLARIARDGRVKTASELELLVNVLDKARSAPSPLAAFALEQVKHAVVSGDGPLAGGRQLTPGVIDEAEVVLLRRILFAAGGDGNIAISRAEAEVLFDINDATAGAAHHPSWDELFVKAIANFLLAASGYLVPSRAEALRREQWLDAPPQGLFGFFRRMIDSPAGILDAYRQPGSEETLRLRNAYQAAAQRHAEQVTEEEARWLAERIGRNGTACGNERALLDLVQREAANVHPLLRPLLGKVA